MFARKEILMLKLRSLTVLLSATAALMVGCVSKPERTLPLPTPQKVGEKAYVVTYRHEEFNRPADKIPSETSLAVIMCDGKGHIRFGEPDADKFSLVDYNLKINFQANRGNKTYTNAGLVNPHFPVPFISPCIVDEESIQNTSEREPEIYLGQEKLSGYECRHYKSNSSERVEGECWYCPQLNCCVKYHSNSVAGTFTETLVNYKSDVPDPALFQLTNYHQVPCSEFYKNNDK